MILALVTAHAAASPSPFVLLGWTSGFGFVLVSRGRWSSCGRFGIANALTSLRLMLIGTLPYLPGPTMLALAAFTVLLMDAADGWLARRHALASEFGARFDVEADAFFVGVLSLLVSQRGDVGPWVLACGLWRYSYMLLLWFTPAFAEAPRFRLARFSYALAVICLMGATLAARPAAPWLAFAATGVISFSFLHSIRRSRGARREASRSAHPST